MSLETVMLLFVAAVSLIAAYYEYEEAKTGVATFPTMPKVRRKIIEILQHETESCPMRPFVVLDLGSGSGQMTWRLARALPEAKVIGIESAYVPWLRSVWRQRLFGPSNLVYKRLDFWPYDCSEASALVTYLPGKIMDRVGEKLRRELRPGALVIANVFPLRGGWEPYEVIGLRAPFKTKVYVYRQL
jgi:precorrin-6B methylase 2